MSIKNNKQCPNCNHDFNKDFDFCPYCGQRNKEIKLGIKYLVDDFLSGSFNIDSKFFLTFRYLITKPAFITKEFLEGKRAKYITPIRIYLLVSLVFFTVLSFTGGGISYSNKDNDDDIPVIFNETTTDSLDVVNDTTIKKTEKFDLNYDTDSTDNESFMGVDLNKLKTFTTKKGRKAFKEKFNEYISVSMFFVMPIAALFLFWFFGKGTYYFEHLIFLIHLQSLIFLIWLVFALLYFFIPFSFIDSIGDILIYGSVIVWIKYFYNYKWVKSVFASLLFLFSYFMILGISFIILAWISLIAL